MVSRRQGVERLMAAGLGLGVALAVAGSASASASTPPDRQPPSLALDTALAFPVGTDAESDRVQGVVSWRASDPSGICEQRVKATLIDSVSGPLETRSYAVAPSVRQRAVTFLVSADLHYSTDVQVTAKDCAGNVSTQVREFLPRPHESTEATPSAGWTSARCACWSGGSTLRSSQVGARLRLDVTGAQSVAVVGDRAPGRGQAKVFLDGAPLGTVDLGGAVRNRVVVFQTRVSGTHSTPHHLDVVVAGGRVDVDAFVVTRSFGSG